MKITEIISEAANPAQQAAIAIAMKKAGKKPKDMAEGSEKIIEYRDRMYQYLKSIVPGFPDYVVKDWLYANFARGATQGPGWSFDTIGKDIPKILKGMGLSVDTKWQLVPNMKFTMDMWEPKTLKRLQARAGGSSKTTDPDVHIPHKDAERHATQAALAQQQGGIRKEPVILIKTSQGYELLEGWHRTIQHFAMYPQGYTGPAYVAVAQGQQGVAEGETWAKHNNPRAGGMSKKSVSSYRRSHPGSKIQTAVTTKPSKLKKGNKDAKRRKSFCARMRGMKKHRTSAKTAHDPNSNINKSLRRWHCESIEELHELVMLAEQFIQRNRK